MVDDHGGRQADDQPVGLDSRHTALGQHRGGRGDFREAGQIVGRREGHSDEWVPESRGPQRVDPNAIGSVGEDLEVLEDAVPASELLVRPHGKAEVAFGRGKGLSRRAPGAERKNQQRQNSYESTEPNHETPHQV